MEIWYYIQFKIEGRMYNILIADDHKIVRYGMKSIIEDDPQLNLVGEASDGKEVLELLKDHHCDLVILDLNMPGKDGFFVLDRMDLISCKTKFLVMSVSSESHIIKKALSHNIAGFLNKAEDIGIITKAIYEILNGKKYFSKNIQEYLDEKLDKILNPGKKITRMTSREQEILQNIRSGRSNKEISELLGISIHTVQFHRSNIIKKFKLKNSAELIRFAVKSDI